MWYLGWSCVTNHSTMCQASSWVAALLHAVTSYSVPFSVSGHCMFSSNICLNTLTWCRPPPKFLRFYLGLLCFLTLACFPLCLKSSDRKCFTSLWRVSRDTEKASISPLGLFRGLLLFEFSIFFGKMWAYWLAVKIMQQLRSSKHEGEVHSGLQRETS